MDCRCGVGKGVGEVVWGWEIGGSGEDLLRTGGEWEILVEMGCRMGESRWGSVSGVES